MTNDDETIRKARAKRLRKQIEQLVSPKDKPGRKNPEESTDEAEVQSPKNESPRDFIHRKMRQPKGQRTASQPAKDPDAR
jgi:hypothetical protein